MPLRVDSHSDDQTRLVGGNTLARQDPARKLMIDKSFSTELVVAPLNTNESEKRIQLPSGISHILTQPDSSKVVVATVEVTSNNDIRRHAYAIEPTNTSITGDARIPGAALWTLYSTGLATAIATYRIQDGTRDCLKTITSKIDEPAKQICFDVAIQDVIETSSSFVVLTENGKVVEVSKENLSTIATIAVPINDHPDLMYIQRPVSRDCASQGVAIVSGRANDTLDGISEYSVSLVDLRDRSVESETLPSPNHDVVRPTAFASCTGAPILGVETPKSPENYFTIRETSLERVNLSEFGDVMPEFRSWNRVHLEYARSDGVVLTAEVILPPHKTRVRANKYPAIVWQYPIRVDTAEEWGDFLMNGGGAIGGYRSINVSAGYSRPMTEHYIGSWLPYLLALDGYAVVAYPDFPLIGSDGNAEHGAYSQQLKSNADALLKAMTKTNLIDQSRIAISGHSRGGATAALLLAETDIFAVGFSYAGPSSFNSHLDGFQYEDRSYWEYPEAYTANSPIFSAIRINEPLLSMYGDLDNLPTREQGEDLHRILTELGGISRLIIYPEELHYPGFRETQISVLEEVSAWLDEHLRPRTREPIQTIQDSEEAKLEPTKVH